MNVLASSADFLPIREGFVYALASSLEPSRIRYVGSTWEPRARLLNHVHRPAQMLKGWIKCTLADGGHIVMYELARANDRGQLYDLELIHAQRLWTIGQADLNTYAGNTSAKRPGAFAGRGR